MVHNRLGRANVGFMALLVGLWLTPAMALPAVGETSPRAPEIRAALATAGGEGGPSLDPSGHASPSLDPAG